MSTQIMWIDVTRCTGCGACVEVCPTGAITLADAQAHVNEETCTGCGACANVCPVDAIQPIVQGELIPAPERPLPTVPQAGPLAKTAGATIVATGVSLATRAAVALARAVGRWLTRPSRGTRPPASITGTPPPVGYRGGAGRQARHRRRGR
ncbi:MAG: hypothetical protein DRI48_08040 [Chloroflexi bacterium]|nr:MAG: hypothetical protein DRI48_08040 [Chloroflexota bacterium]